jgi:hypothetical protein
MTLQEFWLFYAIMLSLFIINLIVSQRLDSARLFNRMSLICSCTILLLSVLFKLQSVEFTNGCQLVAATAALGFILALKFLELSFGQEWSYTRQMSLKWVIVYLLAFPRTSDIRSQWIEPKTSNARRESTITICQGIIEYILLRSLLHWIPLEWLNMSPASFTFIDRLARYGLLCILFYLFLTCFLNIMFGLSGLVINLPMNRMFPAFPFAATSLRDFWSYRWNNYIKSSLHRISFHVIPKLIGPIVPMNRKASALFASLLSGLFHEYVYWFITNQWSYKNLLFFLVHGLFVRLEIALGLPMKPAKSMAKFFGWLWTLGIVWLTLPLFFDPWIEIGIFVDMK